MGQHLEGSNFEEVNDNSSNLYKDYNNIVGPLTDFIADEDGNMTIPVDYYEVNGIRMNSEEYQQWREDKEKEFCGVLGLSSDCMDDLRGEILRD